MAQWQGLSRNKETSQLNNETDEDKAKMLVRNDQLVAVIADEDTITGFLLAGLGNIDIRKTSNYLVVDGKTSLKQIEQSFKSFVSRDDIAIVLISQNIANRIRTAVDQHDKAVPAVLEIPSKDNPYDPDSDGLLRRVKQMSGV